MDAQLNETSGSGPACVPTTVGGGSVFGNSCDPDPDPPGPNPNDLQFASSWHHRDHLGSLRVLSDVASDKLDTHDFYPFGTELVTSNGEALGPSFKMYTGHERDKQTGLDYMMARYCSAASSRFVSVDTVNGTPSTPRSWNRYHYVSGNPLKFVDPDGRFESLATWNAERDERAYLRGELSEEDLWDRQVARGAGSGGAAVVVGAVAVTRGRVSGGSVGLITRAKMAFYLPSALSAVAQLRNVVSRAPSTISARTINNFKLAENVATHHGKIRDFLHSAREGLGLRAGTTHIQEMRESIVTLTRVAHRLKNALKQSHLSKTDRKYIQEVARRTERLRNKMQEWLRIFVNEQRRAHPQPRHRGAGAPPGKGGGR